MVRVYTGYQYNLPRNADNNCFYFNEINYIIVTFARQNDTKACIILLRIDDPSLNESIHLFKSVKKARVLT
jgi:hypothetical protein